MRIMKRVIEGTIVSKQLGAFGKDEIVYGYIDIRTMDNELIAVKIDSYTSYDNLEVGTDVIIEAVNLGSTDIIVARKVNALTNIMEQSDRHAIVGA